jgi:hypothetical protein
LTYSRPSFFALASAKNEGQKKKKFHSAEGSNPDRVSPVNDKADAVKGFGE